MRMNKPPKLLDLVRERIHAKHYSIRTEEACVDWAKRFILFHNKRQNQAKAAKRLSVVLTPWEVSALLAELNETMWLAASLLYGTCIRLLKGLRLRMKDIEFEWREIIVREGKRNAFDSLPILGMMNAL